ncbi:hypothetical protein fHeYen901_130 [Yersinia phage fHe-Yen9-01]|uniref:Site-specific RNA endonuclease n=1 Tax=Yersinia phage fHe-Yen9-01 TaxID=1965363 RepID=A0A1V0DXM4_9CAUD|nr:endoribonuclease [Yersinia phage fHe-Yen9-01]ARB05903.1 hypothetical protein fHeYen901_130 [Yersinia phage fHe-Yen9-01]
MSELTYETHIRRSKLRRVFETEFAQINASIKTACKEQNLKPFHIRFTPHLLDRAIQREIDEVYMFKLFNRLHTKVKDVVEYLEMTPLPAVEYKILPGVEYRPFRLELTDGNLWLGLTVDNPLKHESGLRCRMAIVNNRRLEGKIGTKVINL